MPHRSRLAALVIDSESSRREAAANFWAGALGRVRRADDDSAAEVTRLEKLGARRLRFVDDWWVMEAPSGQVFCVIPVQSTAWPEGALEWPDGA